MIRPVKVAATVAVAAALGASTSVPVALASGQTPPRAVAAATCSRGTPGRINGTVKCLQRGQYCTHSADSQYRYYGFRCVRIYSNGRYRLT
jgi:hypothetical protein